jgi:NTP pyrophosphatase (non-canonical NTP hydrolase)
MMSSSGVDRLDRIRERLRAFTAERDWAQFHDPKNLAMAIVSEAGELAAELRWVANAASDEFMKHAAAHERVEREIADVAIALLLFCDRADIDLLDAIERKIELNAANYPADVTRGRSDRPATQTT